ncbi:MAG: hypothetical protein WBL21_01795 [Salinimicrobium sp.]
MKKYLILFLSIVSFSAFMSCSDDEVFTTANYVSFEAEALDVTVQQNGSNSLDVTVYTSQRAGSDRTFSITVDNATTLDPAVYSLPETVVVPAGTNEATFTVQVEDNNLQNSGGDLVLSLDAPEDVYTGQPITVSVFKFCPVTIDDYVGTFEGTDSWGYPTEVEIFYNDAGELMINGVLFGWFQDWWGEVIVKNEPVKIEINAETGAVTIPEQFYLESTYEGELQTAYSLKGTGRVNACEKILTLNPVLVQGGSEYDGSDWGPAFQEVITVTEDTVDTTTDTSGE